MTCGLYVGEDKSGLEKFCSRKLDVLIGSKCITTGIDGLQFAANQIIVLISPWTSAEYDQLIGRIHRQGAVCDKVKIVVPQVVLGLDQDKRWSWDEQRTLCIKFKRDLAGCAVDGNIPVGSRISEGELVKWSTEALRRWISRVSSGGHVILDRNAVSLFRGEKGPESKLSVVHGESARINNRWSNEYSSETHERLRKDPSEWYRFHSLRKAACRSWPEIPCEVIGRQILQRPDWIVADFGCGECGLLDILGGHTVISIDHVACRDTVISADMASTPLEDGSVDAVVFSLSLTGRNWRDYLAEANRVLRPYGTVFIAVSAMKWNDGNELVSALEDSGFLAIGPPEQRYRFLYFRAARVSQSKTLRQQVPLRVTSR